MLSILASIFGGGGAVKAVESVAKEWIETEGEKAEAKALMVKTLDPNGLMRRDISQRVTGLYSLYIVVMLILVLTQSFTDLANVGQAIKSLTDLFVPITAMFSAIVGASFGVHVSNNIKDKNNG